jgi:hypothetical protein
MEVKLTKVENGYVLQITKFDFQTRTPEEHVYIFTNLDAALAQI